ncbi:hypothetical protein ACFQRC_03135 [Enterovirga sp. GCM10030262]|uniref:calcium-binding protein n=1 Tax=Enterovirga sp. GCM10030262 TaxID=3273391 RepID=UPI00360F0A61
MAMIDGTSGNDTLLGTILDDELRGLGGDDLLRGRAGDDRLNGGSGFDLMVGRAGGDVYFVDSELDRIREFAGEGIDSVNSSVSFRLQRGIENLRLTGTAESGRGNDLDNRIIADQDNADRVANVLNGGEGADFMSGGWGSDTYFVDNPGDTIEEDGSDIDTVRTTVSYTLAGSAFGEFVENMVLIRSDAIDGTGNGFNNRIVGNDANNVIKGELGRDALIGGAGDDSLYGGGANDRLFGGVGNDGFYFEELSSFADRIVDFSSTDDAVFLDRAVFTQIEEGALDPESFVIGTEAQDANDRVIYDPDSGWVRYDPDGSGGQTFNVFLTLPPGTVIEHTDFVGYG